MQSAGVASFIAPRGVDDKPDLGRVAELYCMPFDEKQQAKFIQKFANVKEINNAEWKAESYSAELKRMPGMDKLAREPLVLFQLLYMLPTWKVQHARARGVLERFSYRAMARCT